MNFPKSYSSHCILIGLLIQFTFKATCHACSGIDLKLHFYNAKIANIRESRMLIKRKRLSNDIYSLKI